METIFYLVDLFVVYPLIPVAPVEHVADATSRGLNTEVKMICRKKLDFMSHIANCQLPKNMETKHLNLTFSMLEICFHYILMPVEHVADATSRGLNTEVKMICRKKLEFMSHIANCQLPKNMETKHLNLTFSMLEICFHYILVVKHVADATSRGLNTEVKMICRKKLDFMSHIANCQLPKNMETKHLNLTFSMLEICFHYILMACCGCNFKRAKYGS